MDNNSRTDSKKSKENLAFLKKVGLAAVYLFLGVVGVKGKLKK